jgi:chromosome segregation ATPase
MPSGKRISVKKPKTTAQSSEHAAKNVTRNQMMVGGAVAGTLLAFGGIYKLSTDFSSAASSVNKKATAPSETTVATTESTPSKQVVNTNAIKSKNVLNAASKPIERRVKPNHISSVHSRNAIEISGQEKQKKQQEEVQTKLAQLEASKKQADESVSQMRIELNESKKQAATEKERAEILDALQKQTEQKIEQLTTELEAEKTKKEPNILQQTTDKNTTQMGVYEAEIAHLKAELENLKAEAPMVAKKTAEEKEATKKAVEEKEAAIVAKEAAIVAKKSANEKIKKLELNLKKQVSEIEDLKEKIKRDEELNAGADAAVASDSERKQKEIEDLHKIKKETDERLNTFLNTLLQKLRDVYAKKIKENVPAEIIAICNNKTDIGERVECISQSYEILIKSLLEKISYWKNQDLKNR